MDCSVQGCGGESNGQPKGNDTINLCDYHFKAWGFYRAGYYTSLGKDDGRIRKRLWDKAMIDFLEYATIEIEGLKAFAEELGGENGETEEEVAHSSPT